MSDESTDADVILPGAEFRRMINELEQLRFVTDDLNRQVSSSLDQRDAALAEVQRLDAEVERCHERLEIDHAYSLGPDGEFVRFEVPMEDRPRFPDAVMALKAEVHCLTGDRDELGQERDKLFEAARALVMSGKVARGYVKVDAEKFAALAQLLIDLSEDGDDDGDAA